MFLVYKLPGEMVDVWGWIWMRLSLLFLSILMGRQTFGKVGAFEKCKPILCVYMKFSNNKERKQNRKTCEHVNPRNELFIQYYQSEQ